MHARTCQLQARRRPSPDGVELHNSGMCPCSEGMPARPLQFPVELAKKTQRGRAARHLLTLKALSCPLFPPKFTPRSPAAAHQDHSVDSGTLVRLENDGSNERTDLSPVNTVSDAVPRPGFGSLIPYFYLCPKDIRTVFLNLICKFIIHVGNSMKNLWLAVLQNTTILWPLQIKPNFIYTTRCIHKLYP